MDLLELENNIQWLEHKLALTRLNSYYISQIDICLNNLVNIDAEINSNIVTWQEIRWNSNCSNGIDNSFKKELYDYAYDFSFIKMHDIIIEFQKIESCDTLYQFLLNFKNNKIKNLDSNLLDWILDPYLIELEMTPYDRLSFIVDPFDEEIIDEYNLNEVFSKNVSKIKKELELYKKFMTDFVMRILIDIFYSVKSNNL